MGAIGEGILENDTTVDYLINLQVLFEAKEEKDQIRKHFVKMENERLISSYEHDIDFYTEFWTAISYAQWMYSDGVEKEVLSKIERIVNEKPFFYCWGEPDQPQLRLESVKKFYNELENPRQLVKNKFCKFWFFESSRTITNNFISDQIEMKYEGLKYSNYRPEKRTEILLKLLKPLENDYEEIIFWSTIAERELNYGEVQNRTRDKLSEIYEGKDSLRVFRVAYSELSEKEMYDSVSELIKKL